MAGKTWRGKASALKRIADGKGLRKPTTAHPYCTCSRWGEFCSQHASLRAYLVWLENRGETALAAAIVATDPAAAAELLAAPAAHPELALAA